MGGADCAAQHSTVMQIPPFLLPAHTRLVSTLHSTSGDHYQLSALLICFPLCAKKQLASLYPEHARYEGGFFQLVHKSLLKPRQTRFPVSPLTSGAGVEHSASLAPLRTPLSLIHPIPCALGGYNSNPAPRHHAGRGRHPATHQRVRSASKKHSENHIPRMFSVF